MTTDRIRGFAPLAAVLLWSGCATTTSSWLPPATPEAGPTTPAPAVPVPEKDAPSAAPAAPDAGESCACEPCARATVGIETVDASRALRRRHGLAAGVHGAMVVEVLPDSPAERAGIVLWDVIERIDETDVHGFGDFESTLASSGCAGSVRLALRRGGDLLTLEVQPVDAARFFDGACAKSSATGCFYLGWLTTGGVGVAEDPQRGKQLYEAACRNGSGKACRELSQLSGKEPDLAPTRIQLLERACALHLASACGDLGARYATGRDGIVRDDGRAATLFADACDGGEPVGCSNLGVMYEKGRGVPLDFSAAFSAYEDGCAGAASRACGGLGVLYEKGLGVEASAEKAAELYDRACRGSPVQGPDFEACLNVGQMYREGCGVARDPGRAAEIFEDLCDRSADDDGANDDCDPPCDTHSFAHGCSLFGALFAFGIGVEHDQSRAIELSQQGCDRGDTFGCFNLGVWYGNGDGVAADEAAALAYFRRACDGGDLEACFQVGVEYYEGRGVKQSAEQAAAFYQRACDGNNSKGCSNLGILYEEGTGVPRDVARGLALSDRACELGEAVPCFNLANRYAEGYLVRKDRARAVELYEKACARGYQPACKKVERP